MNTQRSNNQIRSSAYPIYIGLLLGLLIFHSGSYAQTTYIPIAVTGFQHDVIADTGTSVLATTTTMIDGSPAVARHVLYSATFAANNGFTGGLADNGTIVSGKRTYQLAPYIGKNALYLSRNATVDSTKNEGTLSLVTPGYYARLSLVAFSTEGSSYLNIDINYTDGTSERAMTNAFLTDWYVGTANVVLTGPGRITRDTVPPFSIDGVGLWPKFYSHDFMTNCNNQNKMVKSVTIIDTTVNTGSRIVVLALSGESIQPYNINSTVLPARCGVNDNGYVSVNVTGGVKPFTYQWNTTPVQTTPFASGLPAGNYTVNVRDSNGCIRPYTATVALVTPAAVIAKASSVQVCAGTPVTLYADTTNVPPGGTYIWNPGSTSGSAIVVSPGTTTKFYVDAEDKYGCPSSDTVEVTVKPAATAAFTISPDPVCPNTPQLITYTGNGNASATYNWNGFGGAAVQYGAGAGPYGIVYGQPGTYNIKLEVNVSGCISSLTKQVHIDGPLITPIVKMETVTTSTIAFSWEPVPGAIGYIVSVNGSPYITPTSGSLGTSHSIINLQPVEKMVISVIALGAEVCRNSAIGKAEGTTLTDEVFIPNSFSPNGDGKNEFFRAYGNAIASGHMKVFNQWGELIYEGSEYTTGWDGKHKGKLQPMGVYFYVIKIKLVNGAESNRKGSVNLLH